MHSGWHCHLWQLRWHQGYNSDFSSELPKRHLVLTKMVAFYQMSILPLVHELLAGGWFMRMQLHYSRKIM